MRVINFGFAHFIAFILSVRLLLNAIAFIQVHALSTNIQRTKHRIVVVGKIIVDEYGRPDEDNDDDDDDDDDDGIIRGRDDMMGTASAKQKSSSLTIGGGGPQAAWGVAAALATRSFDSASSSNLYSSTPPPPPQPVTFIGPVGSLDWSFEEQSSLLQTLNGVLDTDPVLVRGENRQTPRVRLWHDEEEKVQWYALNGSFGTNGADGLWRDSPTVNDILPFLQNAGDDASSETNFVLHCILEGGANAPGGGQDASPFHDSTLWSRISYLGVEPVVFVDEKTGRVAPVDAASCANLMKKIVNPSTERHGEHGKHPRMIFSPDKDLYDMLPNNFIQRELTTSAEGGATLDSFAIRAGANGSIITNVGCVPAAKLITADGMPKNPTGAGNAYAGAYTACRGTGSSMLDAACIATGVGAVVCEYDHLPPWTYSVIQRIREAAEEVKARYRQEAGRVETR